MTLVALQSCEHNNEINYIILKANKYMSRTLPNKLNISAKWGGRMKKKTCIMRRIDRNIVLKMCTMITDGKYFL
jgi:hypothetical protein